MSGNSGINVDFSQARAIYNAVKGDAFELTKYAREHNIDVRIAKAMFRFAQEMDTDGKIGISDDEYKAGIVSKKELAEIRHKEIYETYIPEEDREAFTKMSQEEKLNYLSNGRDRGSAVMILEKINNIDNEVSFLNAELEKLGVKPKETAQIAEPFDLFQTMWDDTQGALDREIEEQRQRDLKEEYPWQISE
mgnify:CR=1 FL=1